MKCCLSLLLLLLSKFVHGQANPTARAKADSVYQAELQEIAQKKRNAALADSLALASYLSTRPEELSGVDAKNGFRDLKFGVSVSQVRGLVPYGKPAHGEQMYVRPADSRRVGEATLSGIYYTFYKGKLMAVTLETKGYSNSQALFKACKSLYGEPQQPNRYIEYYQWPGSRVAASFAQRTSTHDGTITLLSKTVSAQMKAEQEKAARKAASDL